MKIDQRLIDRFYQGESNPEEARQVMAWLLEQEPDPSLAKDWSDVSPAGEYPEAWRGAMLDFIQADIHRKAAAAGTEDSMPVTRTAGETEEAGVPPRPALLRHLPWKPWVAAASIALLAGIFLPGLFRTRKTVAVVSAPPPPSAQLRPVCLQAPAHEPLTIRMADGSTVLLEAGSSLQYDSVAYNLTDRMLQLKGQAVFAVAAEKDKPFSVQANGFSTTALGTSFRVTAKPAGGIAVRLYSGKVVIRRLGKSHPPASEVYLAPGEEMACRDNGQGMLVSRWQEKENRAPGTERLQPLAAKRKDVRRTGDTLVFDNAQLATVLDVLKRRYHVSIHYDRSSLSDAWFTGTVLPGDPIELILKTVTRMNNLTLVTAGEGFIIK